MFKFIYILTYPFTLIELALIGIYRLFIRHATPKSCKFIPSCSTYAKLSLIEFGFILGNYYIVKRIIRCNPKNCGGYDFVKLNLSGNYKWKC